MKKEFTKKYIIDNKGCYDINQVNSLSFINNTEITILDIINSEMPTKDKIWFLFKKSDLTLDQKKELSYLLAENVSHIYNERYPSDNRVKDCIKAIKDFNNNPITKEKLLEFRRAAADAADAAADTADAAYAADAADAAADTADAAYAADAADAAYAAAYAAAAAAYAADAAAYAAYAADAAAAYAADAAAADAAAKNQKNQQLINIIIDFINKQF